MVRGIGLTRGSHTILRETSVRKLVHIRTISCSRYATSYTKHANRCIPRGYSL